MGRCLLLLTLLWALPARAERHTTVLVADLGLHVIGIGMQTNFTNHFAGQIALESWTPWTQNINLLGLSGDAYKGDASGVAVRARGYIHPFHDAPEGFWVSPFAQGGFATATVNGTSAGGPTWAVGASAGWAWMLVNTIHISLGGGMQLHAATFPGAPTVAPSFRRLYPTLDASIGWAFF